LVCAEKISSGAKLPNDGMHGAQCSTDLALAVCATGACNRRTDRCAEPEGERCDSAAECASNACLKNVCVPSSEAPLASRLDGGRCSITHVAGSSERTWSIFLLAALGFAVRLVRRRRGRAR
jgi:hypothetical protein